jgi:hypothetical protein
MQPATENLLQTDEVATTQPVSREQIKALRDCIEAKIRSYGTKGTKNKKGAASVQVIIIVFSVITPILIGWKTDEQTAILYKNWALAASTITAGFSTLHDFFDYKELWTQYKVSRNGMETISAELNYLESSGTLTQRKMDELFERYIKICSETDGFYRDVRLAAK